MSSLPSSEKSAASTAVNAPANDTFCDEVASIPPPLMPFQTRRRWLAVPQQLGDPTMRSRNPSPLKSTFAKVGIAPLPLP